MTPLRKRKILTSQEKQKLLDEFTKSQLSAEKFATKNGIGHSTLMRWRRESRVNASCISSNGQLTPETANLFFELTKPIELKNTNNFPGDFDAKHFVQKSSPIRASVSCVIAVPSGITITVESMGVDQLAKIIQGFLP